MKERPIPNDAAVGEKDQSVSVTADDEMTAKLHRTEFTFHTHGTAGRRTSTVKI